MSAAHPVVRLGLLHMTNFQRWFTRLRLHPSWDKQHKLAGPAAPRRQRKAEMPGNTEMAHSVPLTSKNLKERCY
eukprot:superscaffoldBa00000517_g5366